MTEGKILHLVEILSKTYLNDKYCKPIVANTAKKQYQDSLANHFPNLALDSLLVIVDDIEVVMIFENLAIYKS